MIPVFKLKRNGPGKNTPCFVIPQGVTIEGDIKTALSVQVEGNVTGNISSDNVVTIGLQATLSGNIQATEAIVLGRVLGNINCINKAMVDNYAYVDGIIVAPHADIKETATVTNRAKSTISDRKTLPKTTEPEALPEKNEELKQILSLPKRMSNTKTWF